MKLARLTTAVLLSLPATGVFAAALDRSGQSISAFLQPGNYFEAGISVLDPSVSGKDTSGNSTGNMAGDYYFPSAALKIQATDQISFGLLYDQPFGADAEYTGNNNFTAKGTDRILGSLPVFMGAAPAPGAIGLNTGVTGGTSVTCYNSNSFCNFRLSTKRKL